MKLARKVDLWMGFCVIVALVMLAAPSWADNNRRSDPDCNGVGNCNDIDIEVNEGGDGYGGRGGEGGTADASADAGAEASAEAEAAATANSDATGGSVGDITFEGDTIPANTTHKLDAKIKNTPDIVTITPGSGDDCKAHIGFSASVPGIGTGLNIPLPGKECRKLKAYDRAIAMRQWRAAEIMFCSLKEVKAEFKDFGLVCVDILTLHITKLPEPEPTAGKVSIGEAEYELLLMAQQQTEEFEEQQQMVEDKFAQYDNLIEEREAEHEADDAEIERLKREAAALRASQEERKEREMTQQSAFGALYSKRLAQEIEEPAQEEEPNE
jgi:hypothetical protein